MKYAPVVLLTFFLYRALVANARASSTETEIRRLEKAQCNAIVQHDLAALYKLWADDFTVNSPTNDMVKSEAAKYAIRNGFIDYSLFKSNLEK